MVCVECTILASRSASMSSNNLTRRLSTFTVLLMIWSRFVSFISSTEVSVSMDKRSTCSTGHANSVHRVNAKLKPIPLNSQPHNNRWKQDLHKMWDYAGLARAQSEVCTTALQGQTTQPNWTRQTTVKFGIGA